MADRLDDAIELSETIKALQEVDNELLGAALKEYLRTNDEELYWEGYNSATMSAITALIVDFKLAVDNGIVHMSSIVAPPDEWNHRVILKQDFYCIELKYQGRKYIWRYAYTTEEQAQNVCTTIQSNFGQPVGRDMDVAANYWRYTPSLHLEIVKRTRGENYYILNPNS